MQDIPLLLYSIHRIFLSYFTLYTGYSSPPLLYMQDIPLFLDSIHRIFLSSLTLYAGYSSPPLLYKHDIPLFLDPVKYFTFHMISQTDLRPSPAPHFNTVKVLLIYFLKGSSLNTIQSHAPIVPLQLHYPNT